jgi:polysaccharide pyruvyl transferase WcaK-like protein
MRNRDAEAVLGEVLQRAAMSVLGVIALVLGLRMHSLIPAGAQGAPGINHDPKIGGFMEEAGVEGFLCHPLYPFECVLERVESALEDGAKVRSRLLKSCEGMKERIRD